MLAGIVISSPASAESVSDHHMLGQAAPGFDLECTAGNRMKLSELRGEYVVVHFATTWCPYCRAEAAALQRLHETYGGQGVRVVVIDVMEDREKVAAWAEDLGWTIPVLLDTDGAVTASYAPDVLPEMPRHEVPIASNLLIDRDGRIQFYSLLDSRNFDARLTGLEARLKELMAAEKLVQ
jgi:peroxiredoxin